MPAWVLVELDTTPPAITWRAVTVLSGVLVVVYEWAGPEEAITAAIEDPAGDVHAMDVSTPGQLRYVLPGGATEGIWAVYAFDDVLNPVVYPNIVLRSPRGFNARQGDELDVVARPTLELDLKATNS